jgi:heme exporter protein A
MTAMAIQDEQSEVETVTAAVEMASLGKRIDERIILRDVNLHVRPGESVAILGANGAGKSTLLRIVSTLLPATTGTLKLFDETITRQSNAVRGRIGVVAHQPMVYRDLTARENLRFFAKLYGVRDADGRAMRMLEMVGLAERANDAPKTFSRGMTQRLAVARALLHDPELLLADEPFDGLDAPSADAMEDLLHQLHAAGKTILMVNHDLAQTLRVARRVVVLRGGTVALDEPAEELTVHALRAEVGLA